MKKAVYRFILFAAIAAFILPISPSVKADPNDAPTNENHSIASDTKPSSNADKQEPAVSKENSQLELAKEQLRGDFYKDSQDNLKLALGIIVTFVVGLILYTVFKDRKEYEKACANAEKAYDKAELSRTQAEKACENARGYERQAQDVLEDIEKRAKTKLEEIDTRANDKQENIDKLVADKLEEIEKISNKQKEESSSEFERQRKISELFNKGWKVNEAKDYETAADCYRQIVEEQKEDKDPDVYNNWGIALWGLGKIKKGKEAEALFKQALEKYQKAIEIVPGFCEASDNWGLVLSELAKRKKGKEAEELFNQAIGKHKKAIEIKPDCYSAYNNWGTALAELAQSKKGKEAEQLLYQALEKHQKAIEIKPDFCEAYYGWGSVLSRLAESKKGREAEELFNQAIGKCKKAIEIRPDYCPAYNGWGGVLLYLAKLKGGKDAEDLVSQAEEKCLKAESIKTGEGAYNLACVYARRGNEDKCQEWLKIEEKADTPATREYAMADDDLKSVRRKAWFKKLRWKGE